MAMSPELQTFCQNWREKAATYSTEDVRGAFDKFFTLYVAFNRLYAEATFRLARQQRLSLRDCYSLRDRFPDSKGAQQYLIRFCGARRLIGAWEDDPETKASLVQIIDHLRQGRFALKLDMASGDRRPEADRKLLDKLESTNPESRARAGLEALYAIRCNMFHGHKGFNEIQIELLRPAISLLENTIKTLQQSLEEDNG